MSMMTSQNKVTAAEVPRVFPVTDQSTVNHGKVQVSCIFYHLQIKPIVKGLLPMFLCNAFKTLMNRRFICGSK